MTPGGTRSIASAVAALVLAGGLVLAVAAGALTRPAGGAGAASAADLTLRQLAGQRLVCAFNGTDVPAGLKRLIDRGELAGVILFADNIRSRRQARRLTRRLRAGSDKRPPGLRGPLLVMSDQEGGLVKRLSGPPRYSAAQMGRRGARVARAQGVLTAKSLRAVGINVDLAPVLDVGRPGSFIRAQHRSFSGRAGRVSRVGVAFARGLQAEGVAATAKHFPGLGAARSDTDFHTSVIPLSKHELRTVDELPYGAFRDAGGSLVMLDSAAYPAFGSGRRPAMLTKSISTGELRGRLGFGAVTITDAMETPSALSTGGPVATGVRAVKAGADLLLYASGCRTARRVAAALRRGLRAGQLDRSRFEVAVDRVLDLRRSLTG